MVLRICLKSFLSIVITAGSLWAQQTGAASSSPDLFQISGILVDSQTSQPIAGARVVLSQVTQRDAGAVMITGPEGAFAFAGLSVGKYRLSAHARGYALRSFNQHEQFASAIAVGPDPDSTHLLFRLPRECSISGVITDEADEPVRNAEVILYVADRASGGATRRISETVTDDEGTYRIRHLSSGRYLLAVKARPWYAQHWQHAPGASPQEEAAIEQNNRLMDVAYPVTFNGSVTDVSAATFIFLGDGDQATADIALQPVPAARLPLNVDIGVSDPRVQVVLEQHVMDGQSLQGMSIENSSNGARALVGLAPGRYSLRTFTSGSADAESVSREIEVSPNGSIETKPPTLTYAIVSAEVHLGPGSTGPANLRLLEKNLEEAVSGKVGTDGKVAFPRGIAPGSYEIALASGSGVYVKSIAAAGASLTGRTINIRPGTPVKLTVTTALGEGTVSGLALLKDKPHGGAMIVLVPADPANNHVLFRRDQSNTDGSFILRYVVPGAYTVLAMEDWEIDWMDPDVLKRYLGLGTAVQVQPNGSYDLKVAVQGIR